MKLIILIVLILIVVLALRALTRKRSDHKAISDSTSANDSGVDEKLGNKASADSIDHARGSSESEGNANQIAAGSAEKDASGTGTKSAVALAAAGTAAAAVAANAVSNSQTNAATPSAPNNDNNNGTSPDGSSWLSGLNTGDQSNDIREMFKILNLRDSDSARLGISQEAYSSLRAGDKTDLSAEQLNNVADRLRNMFG